MVISLRASAFLSRLIAHVTRCLLHFRDSTAGRRLLGSTDYVTLDDLAFALLVILAFFITVIALKASKVRHFICWAPLALFRLGL